jgi:hypothetical protein
MAALQAGAVVHDRPALYKLARKQGRFILQGLETQVDKKNGVAVPAQPVDATQALNLSAGVSNCKVSRGRSLS